MTGGHVDHLDITGITADIRGGVVGTPDLLDRSNMYGGHIVFRGGIWLDHIVNWGSDADLTFEGYYFRVFDRGLNEGNHWRIEGYLADGSFTNIFFSQDLCSCGVTIGFSIIDSPLPAGDTDGDWDVDLDDLNTVRNNFGGTGAGDLDQDGEVGLSDLNLVRNAFGFGHFSLPVGFPGVQEITESTVLTPEPASSVLFLITSLLLVSRKALRRLRRTPTLSSIRNSDSYFEFDRLD